MSKSVPWLGRASRWLQVSERVVEENLESCPKVKGFPTRVYRSLSDQESRTQSLDLERHITKFPIEYQTPKHDLAIIEGGSLWF